MHRIASLPGEDPTEEITLVEQPSAPVLLLTTATTDISALSHCLNSNKNKFWINKIRALPLSTLSHPAQIDHYIYTSTLNTKVVLIRIIGDTSYWSYGLEQFNLWANESNERHLIIISGAISHYSPLSS